MKAPTLFKKFMNLFSSSKTKVDFQDVRHAVTAHKKESSLNGATKSVKQAAETIKASVKNSTTPQKKKPLHARSTKSK
jgi:hypothetical protein